MSREDLTRAVRRVLDETPAGLKELAEESGLSYDVLRSWRNGRRTPHPTSARRLLGGLQSRRAKLRALSDELQQVLDSGAPRDGAA